jgi:chitosanase
MLDLVERYTNANPGNPLENYLPALRKVNGTSSHAGLGSDFVSAWKQAAGTTAFKNAQNSERDRVYFNPAVNQGKSDGLGALGQFVYYDAIVFHGPGNSSEGFGGIRAAAIRKANLPSQGGS